MATEIINGLNSFFTFRLGTEFFAVNVGKVTKILEMIPITRVPNSRGYFKGIINHFGEILPVFDGSLKFGLPEIEITRNTCILILVFEFEGQPVSAGIIVDQLEKVITLNQNQIKPAALSGNRYNTELIEGIAEINSELVIILNIDKVFSEEEICTISTVE
jgi:chemotaxis signal transduction protein